MDFPILQDVHLELPGPSCEESLTLSGSYDYYHYKIDGTNDAGWGCGYRTLQTICSWLEKSTKRNSHINKIPSLAKIQETLVEIGDKPVTFIGSKDWIGTFEAFLILDHLYDVPCKIVHFESGELFTGKLMFLIEHFKRFKSPVMMGGDVDGASKCILGISYDADESREDSAFKNVYLLVLDPHFHGENATRIQLQKDGWICWKSLNDFSENSFYNFCLPQISAETTQGQNNF